MLSVYEIITKIYNGTTLVKYEVLDINTKRKHILPVETVHGLAMAGALINAEFNLTQRQLTGKNDCDLRKLPKKQDYIKGTLTRGIECLTGKKLADTAIEATKETSAERYLVEEVMNYLHKPCNSKICALYGLRRTGKTVMMYHSILRLLNEGIENVAFISLVETSHLNVLYKKIDELMNQNIKYVFIDEITAVNGFIQSSALLADKYAAAGVHIVIAGTDSYIIELASQNNLYDRLIKINTTYIGYKEYEHLNLGTGILDYIRIGGVLPADIFYNESKTKDYVNTAIVENIINSLLRANNRKEHQRLLELEQRGLLRKAIEQAIEASNNELTTSVITQSYVNGTLGSAKQLMEKIFNIDDTLDIEEVQDRVRYRLAIVKDFDIEINDDYAEELRDYLEEIGVIKLYYRYRTKGKGIERVEVPLFIQSGLRYNQTIALLNALCETESFYDIPLDIRQQFKNKIIEDVEGNLLEHEVLISDLMKYKDKNVEITQLNYKGKEIDMIVHEEKLLYLFEIKHSEKSVDSQAKWLVNKELNDFIERYFCGTIKKRIVLYLGTDKMVDVDGKIVLYRKIEDFLKSI